MPRYTGRRFYGEKKMSIRKSKNGIWQIEKLNKKPERTIEEALIRFLEISQGQKDFATKIRHVEYWREALAGRLLSSLTTDDILNAPIKQEQKNLFLLPHKIVITHLL